MENVSFCYKRTLEISTTSRIDVRQQRPFKVAELSRRSFTGVNYINLISNFRLSVRAREETLAFLFTPQISLQLHITDKKPTVRISVRGS